MADDDALGLAIGASPAAAIFPARPQDVLALAGNATATVQCIIRDPLSVNSVTFTASPGGATSTVAVTSPRVSATLTGLTNSTQYTITAVANGPGGASLASAASNPITPTALPSSVLPVTAGLEFWFSATQLALTNGAAVTQLTDFSGNNYHAAQEASGATFTTAWSNSHPAVSYPGTGARHNTIASGLVSGMRSSRQTIYVLYSVAGAPNPGAVAGDRIISVETPFTAMASNGYGIAFAIATGYSSTGQTCAIVDGGGGTPGAGTETLAGLSALNSPIVVAACRPGVVEVNGTSLGINLAPAFDLRSIARKNLALGTSASTIETPGYSFGSPVIGRNNQHFNGSIAEILIYSGTHNSTQRAAVKAYLDGLR